MSAGWIVAALVTLALGALLWRSWLWLARSWEVLDEDQFHEKLTEPGALRPAGWWSRLWFGPRHRQLTYRRDDKGRFRRHRR